MTDITAYDANVKWLENIAALLRRDVAARAAGQASPVQMAEMRNIAANLKPMSDRLIAIYNVFDPASAPIAALELPGAPPKAEKKTKAKAKKATGASPKKGRVTGYILFAKAYRPTVVSENPDAGFGQIGSLTGAAWKAFTDAQRKQWNEAAKKQNAATAAAAGGAAAAAEEDEDEE